LKNGFSKTVLDNGIRVISEHIPSVRSVSIGVWVRVGSRDERADLNGISHFIEHMHFKRTKKRTALQIALSLEALGGSINAFTSRETTCYYARVLHQHLSQAMDILGDILNNSAFAPADIKKEKLVVAEEIKDVADNPSEYIHDLFMSQVWKSYALGQPIMGKSENVKALTRPAVLRYVKDHYRSPNVVIAAAGYVSHRQLVELSKKYFAWPATGSEKNDPTPEHNGFSVRAYRNSTKQTQVCLGFPSLSFSDKDRFPLLVANTFLSGGMSSRLFQTVREKAGYCYSIYSFQEFFRDTGLFSVYFAADRNYVARATNLVLKELHRLRKKLLGRTELSKIKEQLKGSLMLAQESTYNRMNRIARQELMLRRYVDLDKTCRLIDDVEARHVRNVADRIFDVNSLTFTTLGPTRKKEFEDIDWSAL
jgi:predicted Zn-dependent peptidase